MPVYGAQKPQNDKRARRRYRCDLLGSVSYISLVSYITLLAAPVLCWGGARKLG